MNCVFYFKLFKIPWSKTDPVHCCSCMKTIHNTVNFFNWRMFSPSNVVQIRWTCNPIETEAGCHDAAGCLAFSTCCCFLLAINPLTQLCKCCLPQEKLQSPDQQSESGGFWELHMCGGESAGKGQLHWHRPCPKQWVWQRPDGLSLVVPVNTSNRGSENQVERYTAYGGKRKRNTLIWCQTPTFVGFELCSQAWKEGKCRV